MAGDEIREMRKAARLTQEGLAAAVGRATGDPLTRQAVQKWEAGTTFPERDKWDAIEHALGVHSGWMFELSKKPAPTPQPVPFNPALAGIFPASNQAAGRNIIQHNAGPMSGVGDTITKSGNTSAPAPAPSVDAINPMEIAAIQALRDMAPASAVLIVEAIHLFSLVGNRLKLEKCVEELRAAVAAHR